MHVDHVIRKRKDLRFLQGVDRFSEAGTINKEYMAAEQAYFLAIANHIRVDHLTRKSF